MKIFEDPWDKLRRWRGEKDAKRLLRLALRYKSKPWDYWYGYNGFLYELQDWRVNNKEGIREYALESLGDLEYHKASKVLIYFLRKDPCKDVRCAAIKALGKIKEKNATKYIIQACLSEDDFYRTENLASERLQYDAIEALGRIGGEEAVSGLIQILDREKNRGNDRLFYEFALSIIDALGETREKIAVETLINMLKFYVEQEKEGNYYVDWTKRSKSGTIRLEDALLKITGQDFEDDYEKWQQWWEENQDQYK